MPHGGGVTYFWAGWVKNTWPFHSPMPRNRSTRSPLACQTLTGMQESSYGKADFVQIALFAGSAKREPLRSGSTDRNTSQTECRTLIGHRCFRSSNNVLHHSRKEAADSPRSASWTAPCIHSFRSTARKTEANSERISLTACFARCYFIRHFARADGVERILGNCLRVGPVRTGTAQAPRVAL